MQRLADLVFQIARKFFVVLPRPDARPIIAAVIRRVHVKQVRTGDIDLDPQQAHHLSAVLRLEHGSEVEAFDDAGATAKAMLLLDGRSTALRIERIDDAPTDAASQIVVAAAVPKGDRADWMIEKLSELGVARFIPLASARSVVLPEGKNKHDRWTRIAAEAAKQSRRRGVMSIDRLTPLANALAAAAPGGWFLSTAADALPIATAPRGANRLQLFIGPEGGWTDEEMAAMRSRGLTPVALTATILRVETAAVAAAAIVATMR